MSRVRRRMGAGRTRRRSGTRFSEPAAARRGARLLRQGIEVVTSTPEELGAFVKSELARWTPIIKAAGITAH